MGRRRRRAPSATPSRGGVGAAKAAGEGADTEALIAEVAALKARLQEDEEMVRCLAAEVPDDADEMANVGMRWVGAPRVGVSTDLGFFLRRAVYPRSVPAVSDSFRSAARSSGTASTIRVQIMSSSMCGYS